MTRLRFALGFALALAGCAGASPPAALRVVPRGGGAASGAGPVASAEIAADPESRQRGLMGRDFLPPDTGMLFVYPSDRQVHFWMKGCRIALSAAFLDAGGRVLNIAEMVPPTGGSELDLPMYDSRGPARFVLEMEAGWFGRHGIAPGDRVDLSAALQGVVPR